jgi:hypothetical protein
MECHNVKLPVLALHSGAIQGCRRSFGGGSCQSADLARGSASLVNNFSPCRDVPAANRQFGGRWVIANGFVQHQCVAGGGGRLFGGRWMRLRGGCVFGRDMKRTRLAAPCRNMPRAIQERVRTLRCNFAATTPLGRMRIDGTLVARGLFRGQPGWFAGRAETKGQCDKTDHHQYPTCCFHIVPSEKGPGMGREGLGGPES